MASLNRKKLISWWDSVILDEKYSNVGWVKNPYKETKPLTIETEKQITKKRVVKKESVKKKTNTVVHKSFDKNFIDISSEIFKLDR